ncbi:MAG: hypothetical protein V7L29_29600 [Nostoc sp.]|uniref:hypothetical protein n=1 Tax=Nostoc sp. TaxID=1180 RepID=UPI002FFB8DDE
MTLEREQRVADKTRRELLYETLLLACLRVGVHYRRRPNLLKASADANRVTSKASQKQQIVEFITAKNLSINQC